MAARSQTSKLVIAMFAPNTLFSLDFLTFLCPGPTCILDMMDFCSYQHVSRNRAISVIKLIPLKKDEVASEIHTHEPAKRPEDIIRDPYVFGP